MNQGHIGIITRFELRRLRTSAPGVLFLVFFGCGYLWLGIKILGWKEALDAIEGASLPLGLAPEENPIFMALGWLMGLEATALWEIFVAYPPVLTIIFAVTIFVTPFLTLILAMDQTGSDISRRHLRYLSVRTSRRALYVGKTAAVTIYWAGTLALTMGILYAICVFGDLLGETPISESVLFMGRLYLSVVVLGLPFIALAGAASALTGHPALGGLTTFGLWIVVALMSWGLGMQAEGLANIEYLFPTAMKFELMATETTTVLAALVHQLGYAVVLFVLGVSLFTRRDI